MRNTHKVALRKESVDRNTILTQTGTNIVVALRKESVDRNFSIATSKSHIRVALRKESVDRNTGILAHHARKIVSLSARRAWIEIAYVSYS